MIVKTYNIKVTAHGTVLRGVTCEHCGCQYVYKLTRQISGYHNCPDANPQTIHDLQKPVMRRVKRAAKEGIDPVPCPDCAYLQRSMIRTIRLERLAILLLVAVGAMLITLVLTVLSNIDDLVSWGLTVPIVFAAIAFCILLAFAAAILRKDWNSHQRVENRLQKPNIRAIRRNDFPDLPAELFQDAPVGKPT
jgi:hypothetical protein